MDHLEVLEKLRDPEVRASLAEDALVWASSHGLLMVPARPQPTCAVAHAPIALTPVTYPRDTFVRAKVAAEDFSFLMDAIARDEEYLIRTLTPVAKHDDFVVCLVEVQDWGMVRTGYGARLYVFSPSPGAAAGYPAAHSRRACTASPG